MSLLQTGTGAMTLPVGNSSQRPSSVSAGQFRYNTDYNIVEYYNGSRWVTGLGGSPETAASNGNQIYSAYSSSPSGVYWLKTPSGTTYQAYIKMDQGGGWINLITTVGPYTALSAGYGSGGGNMLSSAFTGSLGPFNILSATYVGQNQGGVYACGGLSGISYVNMDSTMKSDLGVTQCRINFSVTSMSNVTCGYICTNVGTQVSIISGNSNYFGVCNNPPNQYSQVNPSSFTGEAIYNMSSNRVFDTYTACTGSMSVALNSVFVR